MELQLLHEIGRINYSGTDILQSLESAIGITKIDPPINEVIQSSLELSWTRNPFDRLIVATSEATGIPLLTKDQNILTNFDLAVW